MANAEDEEELLAQLAKRLETIREDAELARSGSIQSISATLDRTEVRLHDLATNLEALCLRVEQQQDVVERLDATAANAKAETQALKKTVEVLSLRVQQQVEMLDRLSAQKRWRQRALRMGLIGLLLAGSIAVFLWSGHDAGFDALPRRIVNWLSELVGVNATWFGPSTTSSAAFDAAPASGSPIPVASALPAPSAVDAPLAATVPIAASQHSSTPNRASETPALLISPSPAAEAAAPSERLAPAETVATPEPDWTWRLKAYR